MTFKKLIPLVVILAILVALALYRLAQDEPVDIREAARIIDLVPEDVDAEDLTRLELYTGAHPEERVVLARDTADDAWKLASRYNAPANGDEIAAFIDTLTGLDGQYRATAPEDADREPYGLQVEQAFHIEGYAGDDEPAFHIKNGRVASPQTVFMMRAGDEAVYVSSVDLRSEADIAGPGAAPSHQTWLDRELLALDSDELEEIELTMPDKRLVLARESSEEEELDEEAANHPRGDRIIPAANQDSAVGFAAQGQEMPVDIDDLEVFAPEEEGESSGMQPGIDGAPGQLAPPTGPQQRIETPTDEWMLAEGGPGAPIRDEGIDGILRALGGLEAEDVVDPAGEWGLEDAPFRCDIRLAENPEELTVLASRPEGGGPGYVRIEATHGDLVYRLEPRRFEQLFPAGGDLFELPRLDLESDELARIELSQPEGGATLLRSEEDEEWEVEAPAADLNVNQSAIETMAAALASWGAADYADSMEDVSVGERLVRFETQAGDVHEIAVGDASQTIDGVYARLDDRDPVLAMTHSDLRRVFVEPRNLYERTLVDLATGDLASLGIEREEDSYWLQRREDSWLLSKNGAFQDADDEAASRLARSLVNLQANDIVFEATELPSDVLATIQFATLDDEEYTLTIGEEEDGLHPALFTGVDQVLLLTDVDVADLLISSARLTGTEEDISGEEDGGEEVSERTDEGKETVVHEDEDMKILNVEPEETVITPGELEG
ncbi:MAG: DUF4340 domain-containing protein [Candidatus Hydrogenedentota bacterium]